VGERGSVGREGGEVDPVGRENEQAGVLCFFLFFFFFCLEFGCPRRRVEIVIVRGAVSHL
jgi:hypothetical protein